jgi:hypothetical protein
MVNQRFPVSLAVRILQIVGPGQSNVLSAVGKGQRTLAGELRLVGENRRNRPSEFIPDGFQITLMRQGNEAFDGFFVVAPVAFVVLVF